MIPRLRTMLLILAALFAATLAAVHLQRVAHLRAHGPGTAPEARAEYGIVLGASLRDDGSLSTSSRMRTERGLDLLRSGHVDTLIFSGKEDAAAMARYATAAGAPAERLLVEPNARSTLGNIVRSHAIIADRAGKGDGSTILITSAFHAARSKYLAIALGYPARGLAVADFLDRASTLKNAHLTVREAAAWWYNLAKIAAWHALGLTGLSPIERLAYVH